MLNWKQCKIIKVHGIKKVEQKINYIHNNPLHERWNPASEPRSYGWSSAEFYESGNDKYGISTNYNGRF